MSNHKIVSDEPLPSMPGPLPPPPVAPDPLGNVSEVQRLRYSPSDRLVVYTTHPDLTRAQADMIAGRIRHCLDLPGDTAIVVLPDGWSIEVAEPVPARTDAARGE